MATGATTDSEEILKVIRGGDKIGDVLEFSLY